MREKVRGERERGKRGGERENERKERGARISSFESCEKRKRFERYEVTDFFSSCNGDRSIEPFSHGLTLVN